MACTLWPSIRTSFLMISAMTPFLSNAFMYPSYGANHCATHIAQYEKHHGIPDGLLHAISMVESGRKDNKGRVVAWPWTINADGQGYYFPTKEAAIAAVNKLRRQGISSIDVGCMQVNLYHHPNAFRTLNDAFEPSKNVAYAARFLTGLKNEHASWHKAVAHYHSANPIHHIPYHKIVMKAWKRVMKGGNILLASANFDQDSKPYVNRIRRVSSLKTLRSKKEITLYADKGITRKVGHTPSTHIRRVGQKAYSGGRKTLKVS
ncbi:MAG: lytic transglycosylase domain-containing protein [Proteobacteria bacterium]|nr:lytic transglycosylase domain-containing protein [Pseudomonadota bacterium]